ncbi:unnamed protein product [Cylicostephanus goldi]|uniref:Uncharacterized protein n=1 Tax=Cylicostephanus goldi TaxID=71465 RepID=A0A3P7MG04_CYLGO|nr:unnamed protein product [Cylicostephanus goldi]
MNYRMRVDKQLAQPQQRYQVNIVPRQGPDYDEDTFDSLDKALYEDIHALLLRLSEGEFDIWEALEEVCFQISFYFWFLCSVSVLYFAAFDWVHIVDLVQKIP